MNFFFPLKIEGYNSKLTIPKFQNRSSKNIKYSLFSVKLKENRWFVSKEKREEDESFFYINENCDRKIYFLALENQLELTMKTNFKTLKKLNNLTDTDPAYRANIQLENTYGGFSSYQSEYPYEMTKKTGSILSPVTMLTNKNAEKNRILFKNIYYLPLHEKFNLHLIDINNKKILKTFPCKTNTTNYFNITNDLLNENNYLISDKFLGIPLFLSEHEGHLSLEHTHPPHLYMLGNEKYNLIKQLKLDILNGIH